MAFSNHDVVPDSPINNFATWDLKNAATPSNGNLTINNAVVYFSNFPLQENTYVEFYVSAGQTSTSTQFGVSTIDHAPSNRRLWGGNGQLYNGNWGGGLTSYTTGDVIALHMNNSNQVAFYKNGSFVNSFGLPNGDVWLEARRVSSSVFGTVNFGQDPTFGGAKSPTTTYPDANGLGQFHYQPPAGALALCTANIPEGPIKLSQDQTPSDHFKAVTWVGATNGGVYNNGVVTTGMAADLVWIKARETGYAQLFNDSLRGTGVELRSNETGAQANRTDGFTAFNTTGFSVGTNAAYNDSSKGMAAWCWKAAGAPADGGSSVAGSARIINEDGTQADTTCAALASAAGASITPSKVSANRQNGFSIVKYGVVNSVSTVPHGLNAKPEMIICKNLDQSYNWTVYHKDLTSAAYVLVLNSNGKELNSTVQFDSTAPNESVFTVGTGGNTNYVSSTSDNIIAYCWHSVEGYSKFGSYVGNGSTDGPMVYCGFRPAFVMVKRTDASQGWAISDNNRTTSYNPANGVLLANDSAAEQNLIWHDFLSNGFKARQTYTGLNASGGTYIYMAFAEQPFSGPSNAR